MANCNFSDHFPFAILSKNIFVRIDPKLLFSERKTAASDFLIQQTAMTILC